MKSKALALGIILLITSLVVGVASAETYATLKERLAVRTGPGTNYVEVGGFLSPGATVKVRTKVWDYTNGIWWVQVEFDEMDSSTYGNKIRGYTGARRLDVDLSRVPVETELRQCRVTAYSDAFTGPRYLQSFTGWADSVYSGTAATLYEVEDGYAHIECWNDYRQQMWRVWIPLENLDCAYLYNRNQYYGSANGSSSGGFQAPASTRSPSTYYGNTGKGFPVGEWCIVISSSAHVKAEPDIQYRTVGYVKENQWYEILECRTGSTGKDWY